MSQRLGMADGRCFTVNSSNQLLNNYLMKQNGITFEDNYSFRKILQQKGPELLKPVQDLQGTENVGLAIKRFSRYQIFIK